MERHSRYLEIIRQMRERTGNVECGETEIVTDSKKIEKMEQTFIERGRLLGIPEQYSYLGLIWENPWYVVLNEPVLFPSPRGRQGDPIPGSYMRILFKGDLAGQKSVFMLVMTEDGQIILNITYRSTVRDWAVEGPGTATKEGETHEQAILRCAREKIGRKLITIQSLGPPGGVISERGIMGTAVPVYLVTVSNEEGEKPSDLNFRNHVILKPCEVMDGFRRGYIYCDGRRCVCQDSYTSYALFLALLEGQLVLS